MAPFTASVRKIFIRLIMIINKRIEIFQELLVLFYLIFSDIKMLIFGLLFILYNITT